MLLYLEDVGLLAAHDLERDRLLGGVELEVDGVLQRLAVDGDDAVAREQADLVGEAARADGVDDAASIRLAVLGRAADFGHASSSAAQTSRWC